MAGRWDNALKFLVQEKPQDFGRFALRSPEFRGRSDPYLSFSGHQTLGDTNRAIKEYWFERLAATFAPDRKWAGTGSS